MTNILSFLSFSVTMIAFIYGVIRLFRKGKPFYFQILICAAGCSALGQLSVFINYYCDGYDLMTFFSAGVFAYYGCYSFLLCANIGALNRVVNENSTTKVILLSLLAPAVYIALHIWFLPLVFSEDLIFGIFLLPYVPLAAACTYLNMKHLLIKPDAMGFLPGIRGCDICTLIYVFLNSIGMILSWYFDGMLLSDLSGLGSAIALFALVISAVRGAKTWEI